MKRWTRRSLTLAVAVIATVLMLVFTIDLGRFPLLKQTAEARASEYLRRPMHIGRIGATIAPGVFTFDDVVIEGKHVGDRPFLKAGRIYVYIPWWTLFYRELIVEIGLTDWQMLVEMFPDGSSQPRLAPERSATPTKRPFTITARSIYARNGTFIYDDHMTPWSVVAPNLNFALVRAENLKQYVGRAEFSEGTVQIQNYKPMATEMSARFVVDGPLVSLHHIDLTTDGSVSHVNGSVDFAHWPEQTYNVNSTVDFPRMKDIFFSNESWRLRGTGEFTGVFHLFPGGRNLAGNFTSDDAGVNDLDFSELHGSLEWTPEHFVVSHADAALLGGETRFDYSLAPLGTKLPATATFNADYVNVDLTQLNRLMNLRSLDLTGRARGDLAMTWPNGHFRTGRTGHGRTSISPSTTREMAGVSLPAIPRPIEPEPQPFRSIRPLEPLAVAGDVEYRLDPDGWTFENSWAATPFTFVRFSGRLASSGASAFPFHVTSHDWQESDRVLSRIMTAVSGPTGAVEVAGRGTFDGEMTGTFSAPRVAGRFDSRDTRVWDVTWGRAQADAVIEGGYVDIANGRVTNGSGGVITPNGRYALGFRKDGREEINARVSLVSWPMADLRHAFVLDDWPLTGTVARSDLVLTGQYKNMFGSGRMQIDDGTAWGEHFDTVTGDLDLEGTGIRVHRIEMKKGPGIAHGDARVGWDGTYGFTADGEGIPVETLDNFKVPQAPLSGRLRFNASGASTFEAPKYSFRGSIDDLFAGDQGIGRVQGQLRVDGDTLIIERVVANSGLLDVDGRGTIQLNERYDGTVHLRFTQSSIDPYLKFVAPRLSPYTRAIVSGSVDVSGPLAIPADMTMAASIDDATLTLYDYELKNDGSVQLAFRNQLFQVAQFKLKGSDTNLQLTGTADGRARMWDLSASGNASLSILQLFFRGITSSGAAALNASLQGSFDEPRLTGEARITDGRLRPLDSPRSLEAINGPIRFDGTGISMSGLTGRVGGGDVVFGGSIALQGYALSDFNMTASGRSMALRYPVGFNSTVDMDLYLLGRPNALRLTGNVDVLRASATARSVPDALRDLVLSATAGAPAGGGPAPPPPSNDIALDLQVTAPRIGFISTKTDRIEGLVDLHLGGTFNRPSVTGAVDVVGGEFLYNGNRLFIRESAVDFSNPDVIEPSYDLSVDTRIRASGETYNISMRLTGQKDHLVPQFSSDPWLPEADIVSLLFGGTPNLDTAEQRALGSPQESQERMMQSALAALITQRVSSQVGDVVQRLSTLDTVQITPQLAGDVAFQQLNPTARITLGKRIAPRVFLTYSRTVGISAAQDEIILLEYEQNDRVSWLLSRNEDRSFALDFRIRYVH